MKSALNSSEMFALHIQSTKETSLTLLPLLFPCKTIHLYVLYNKGKKSFLNSKGLLNLNMLYQVNSIEKLQGIEEDAFLRKRPCIG